MNKKDIIVLIFCFIISSLVAVFLTHTPGWDWFSYHLYNGWAFVNHRINTDLLASQFRTYFNPVLDALSYLTLKSLNNHPIWFVIVSNIKYAIFLFLSYKIYDLSFINKNYKKYTMLTALILVFFSPVVLYAINFDNNDMQTCLLVLFGLFLFIKNNLLPNKFSPTKKLCINMISGLMFGTTFGLKYVELSCVASVFLTILILNKYFKNPFKIFSQLLLSSLIGFAITDGWWMYILYKKFQNPFFPYFNNLFHSQFANNSELLNSDFQLIKPKNIIDFIFYPLYDSAHNPNIGWERTYFDIKTPLTFVLSCIFIYISQYKKFIYKISKIIHIKIFIFFLIYIPLTYYINQLLFSNVRYIISLYTLSALIIIPMILALVEKLFYKLSLILLIIVSTTIIEYSYHQFYNFFIYTPKQVLSINDMNFKNDSTILCGTSLTSFISISQNTNVKYIGFPFPRTTFDENFNNEILNEIHLLNNFFLSDYLEDYLTNDLLKQNKPLVFLFSENYLENKKIYNEAINKYSQGKIKEINNCKIVRHNVLGYTNTQSVFYACTLK